MSAFRSTVNILRHRAKYWLGRRPRLYHWTYRLRDGYADRLVTDATDLCVEGFPRSANSFAVGAFEHAQPEPLSIAHHNHVPAPVLLIRAQVGKLSLSFGEDRGLLPVGITFRNPFTYQ